jgi:hypothetical protein
VIDHLYARGAAAVAAMEDAYAAAGVDAFAAWAHESGRPLIAALERRGYRLSETTRAMGTPLSDLRASVDGVPLREATWPEYLRYLGRFGVPDGLAFDHEGDCGIYNVSTLAPARPGGAASAPRRPRGCSSRRRRAATRPRPCSRRRWAERVYAAVGFSDLGRILEFAPRPCDGRGRTRPARRRASLRP